MLNLTDTVKIIIIITVFSTLMLMITCILYKLSKLREVMDTQTAMPASADLVSIGLPWRRESSQESECSICKLENGHCSTNAEPCNIPLHKVTRHNATGQEESVFSRRLHEETGQNAADQEERVFTGRLTLTMEYNASNQFLVLKQVTAEDLFPWDYSSMSKTFVTIESQVGITHDKQNSEVQIGVHRVSYEHNFEFNVCDTDLDQTQFVLTVLQHEESGDENLIGECMVAMETVKITSAPGQSLEVSEKLFKQLTKKIETEVLLSLSYLPTAERLSVVVMKAKNIEIKSEETITKNKTTVPNPFVKVCLIYAGRKIKKKKTSVRRQEKNPVYNESMIFDVPANFLHKIGFLITIEHKNFENEQTTVLGRVVIGSPVHNNALRHWNQMLAFPRRPVAAWHKVFHLG